MPRRQSIVAEFLEPDNSFMRQVAPRRSDVTLRWNGVSSAYLTVSDGHEIVSDLLATPGARCAVWMTTIDGPTVDQRRLVEGRVGKLTGQDAPFGSVKIPVLDDWQDFDNLLGWQAPAAGIGGQSAAEYARYIGKSEANAKAAIAANVARLGRPWDVAPDGGFGTVQKPLELRMHSLTEKIVDALIVDRLQLTIERNRATNRWLVDVRTGATYPRPLTPLSGVLAEWSWVIEPPTATRAVVGGRGEGVERQFALVVDSALEAQLGIALEVFVDARNAAEGEPLEPYGWAELAKHRGRAGLSATLRETSWFRFTDGYELGDVVPVRIGALEIEDVIRQIDIVDDPQSGFSVVPRLGLATDDPNERLITGVKDVATAVRGLEKR